MSNALLLAICGLLAWLIASWARRNAGALHLVQAPNERSSHVKPTPAVGGLGIAVGGSLAGIWVALSGQPFAWVVLMLAMGLAIVGVLDDIEFVKTSVRLATHTLVILVIVLLLDGLPPFQADLTLWSTDMRLQLQGGALYGLLVVFGVWWINLFNFMDGIDGIAGTQAGFMLVAGAVLGVINFPEAAQSTTWFWMLSTTAAVVGFLVLNWPPAKIFMGDAGSTYLAFMIFALALISVSEGWSTYAMWLILGAAFISDATVTLLRRMVFRERWLEAHRTHAYQRLSRRWQSHRKVTLLFVGVNTLWLAPLAWVAGSMPQWSSLCLILAYVPILIGVFVVSACKLGD